MEDRVEFMIKSGYEKLRTSEKKAADYILEHLEEVREMPMEKLARNSGVSQPTVVKMAKALEMPEVLTYTVLKIQIRQHRIYLQNCYILELTAGICSYGKICNGKTV